MLRLENVKKSFVEPNGNLLPVLDIAQFHLAQGEQMSLIGHSGSGKTTLLHVVSGISAPDSGRVKINDIDLTRLSEAGRDRFRAENIGYVFQTFNLLPGFSALENVQLGMTFARGKRDVRRAKELLDRVGLSHRLTHTPNTMSVGEQQRTAVARALANQPKLLLADEPTANVDPKNQQSIIELIRQTCREEKVALILVTHGMHIAEQFDRIDQLEEVNQVGKKDDPTPPTVRDSGEVTRTVK